MMYRWYLTLVQVAKMSTKSTNKCWKYKKHEGTFYHKWWTCSKVKKFWVLIHQEL